MKRDNLMTRRLLTESGIGMGMRVLEVGCGGGEVTQILAELVGPSGHVLALDRDAGALATAAERVKAHGLANVQLLAVDIALTETPLETFPRSSFDALAGRRVLMYLIDPIAALRRLSPWLRRGALVVFEEADMTMVPAREASMPAHDEGCAWLRNMLGAEGVDAAMGFHLPAVFERAGFRFERVRAEAVIQGQGAQFPLSGLLGLLRPRLIATGVASAAEIDVLLPRIDVEARVATAVYISEMSFCAWGEVL